MMSLQVKVLYLFIFANVFFIKHLDTKKLGGVYNLMGCMNMKGKKM